MSKPENILPTPEQLSKFGYKRVKPAEIDSREHSIGETLRNTCGNPLDMYQSRKLITETQWAAGDRFRTTGYQAGLQPNVTASYDGLVSGTEAWGGMARTAAQARARREWRDAVQVVGKQLSSILIDVCILDKPAGAFGRKLRNGRSAEIAGMTTLTNALERLAEHYGLG